jgi:protein-tyrosine phosphatase
MTSVLDEIDRALAAGHNVYLHCYAGLGRTGTVVGCFLVRHGLAGDEALRAIRELRRETAFPDSPSPQTEEQARMVRRWRA